VQIAQGTLAVLDESRLRDVPFSDDPVKGARRGAYFSLSLAGTVQAFFDEPTRETLFPPATMLGAELQLHDFFRKTWVLGFDLAMGGSRAKLVRQNTELPFRFGELTTGASLFTEWPMADGRFAPFVGGRLAILFMNRQFDGVNIPKQTFSTFSPGLIAGLRYRFPSGISGVVRTRLHYLLYNVDENRSLGFWELQTAVSYDL
jgi:hypothetical protein